MKTLSLAILLCVLTIGSSFAQGGNEVRDAGNAYYNGYQNSYQSLIPRTVTQFVNDTIMLVTITGLYNAKADNYTSTFALTQYGSTVDSATMFITERLKKFTDQLKKLGIKTADISIDEISQVPVYSYSVDKKLFSSTYNEIPTGYEIKKNIIVGYSDANLMDDIMTAAAKSEIYDIVKVDYNVNDIALKYSQLRKDCLKQIKEKVEDFAAMGLKFQPLQQTFTEASGAHYPLERYTQYTAFNNSQVQATAVEKGAHVNSAAKSTTYYYNKVPYNQFDVVINPNMVEPGVQFTYSVSIKYVMKGVDKPVGLTAPIAKVETPKKQPQSGKVVKMKLPTSVDFKFDTDGE
ncbi:MAG TPA: SIMPL domain-containing protein [Candidatus Kapabacteria bacterium]|nr:SIMPL domain-containing protein [Candidatus Kapabacteria bacterium]